MKLFLRKLIGVIERLIFPTYGSCYRCGRTWNVTKYHTTRYTHGISCFPLCEACWRELTPTQRIPYYFTLFKKWLSYGTETHSNGMSWDETWDAILEAVMDGR
jgi:hypothetical protein